MRISKQSNHLFNLKGQILQLCIVFSFVIISSGQLKAQVEASGYGFNYFPRQWITDNSYGAGYSFYAGVWPIMEEYPGPENFQLGLPSTWLAPQPTGNEPSNFYNTIEGGLGWWHDTRFATETPKFIMGGVSFNFSQWANGPGAGRTDIRPDGHRDWDEPGGKYGIAQLSPHLLWPPDGLNMEQGANGEFLGYGYHPLPFTDVMEETNGIDFTTGNQCWTLFVNSRNFNGPITFFIPTFWTEPVLDDPSLEGLFLDTRPTDKNLAFAMEYAESPALIGTDDDGNTFAKILPLVFPKTTGNTSELAREIKVYRKGAKWDEVEEWFNGGEMASTEFNNSEAADIVFNVDENVDGNISTNSGIPIDAPINYDNFATKIVTTDQRVAGFEWDTNIVTEEDGKFTMPNYYKLNSDNEWNPTVDASVPPSTGLLDNDPAITPRKDDIPYLTPLDPDCHLQDPESAWRSPGPVAGPFLVSLGDGSRLTYYWYKFIDQPSIIHANLPEEMRQQLQERVELIQTNWNYTDEYLAAPTGGTLVGLDPGLIVNPPAGFEIGYVPIVTRQELDPFVSAVASTANISIAKIYPNPTDGIIEIEAKGRPIAGVEIYNLHGTLILSQERLNSTSHTLQITNQPAGIYFLKITNDDHIFSYHRISKMK